MSIYEMDRFGNEIYKDENGEYHHQLRPALIVKDVSESWYKHGKLHRLDGPAIERKDGSTEYWIDGVHLTEEEFEEGNPKIKQPQINESGTEIWRNEDGKLHRDDDLPAVTNKDGEQEYWVNGKLHRLNGPAIERKDGSTEYWIQGIKLTKKEFEESMDWEKFEDLEEKEPISYRNELGQLHREDGPAVERKDGINSYYLKGKALSENEYYKIPRTDEEGNKRWFNENGKLHRDDDLPAVDLVNGYKVWYQNGIIHRNDNPAVIYPNGTTKWYMNGECLNDNYG